MLCYRDKTWCREPDCSNKDCQENRIHIDHDEVRRVGLPICYSDFWKTCAYHKEHTSQPPE